MSESEDRDQEQNTPVQVEVRPITNEPRNEVRKDEKEELIKQILYEVNDELYTYISNKPVASLKRYLQGEPIDVLLDFVSDYGDLVYRRIVKLQRSLERVSRLTGGGGNRAITSQRALEQMLWDRLAQSIAGSVEASVEAQRRRKVSEEIIKELMSEKEESNEESTRDNESEE